MDQPNATFAKILILDTGKFEQWKFRIQQYLQNEHYDLWEVIEFGDSYKAPLEESGKGPASESSAKKKGRTVVITTEDMQKRRNDVKARTTLLLALHDEHQLRFSKYETTKELWEAILKTFGGNEAPKKTKKNQLRQQYSNFKTEGSETLEQTFNRWQAIVSHLEFMDVEIEQDDVNHKFLTSLAPEWLMYTIVWRNKDDLDTMSLNDVYNHLKVYEPEVQKKSESNSQNMAFISSSNTSSGKGPKEEELAPKALMAIDGIKWDWSYMATEEENHALVADDKALTEFTLMAKSSSSSENEVKAKLVEFKEHEIKFCEIIKGLERDVEVRNNKIEYLMNELKQVKKEKEGLDDKLTGFENASKDLDNLLGSQRLDKNKEGLRYNAVPPPPAQVYSPLKKDLSWTGLPEFVDDTVTDYSRPTPSIDTSKRDTSDLKSSNFFVSELEESSGSIMSTPMIKFVKTADCPRVIKTNNTEKARESTIKYAEMYKNTSKSPKVRVYGWKKRKPGQRIILLKNVTPRAVLLKTGKTPIAGNSQNNIDDKGYWDSGCSRHMTDNISYLFEYEPYDGAYVSFGQRGGKITGVMMGRRLISWQCKKQTIVATSTTEAEYVTAASGCGQVLWIQNQMLDYGEVPVEQVMRSSVRGNHILYTTIEQHSPHHDPSSPSHLTTTTEPIPQTPTNTPTETPTIRRYTRRVIRIAQCKALSPATDEPTSLLRDDRQGEAFPTVSSLDAGQERENINNTSALPHESSPRMAAKLKDQDLEISSLKARVKFLEDKDRGSAEPTQEDALIKGGDNGDKGGTVSVSPIAGVSTKGVPTISGHFPTASATFTTASVVTPYTRRSGGISAKDKGKEKVVESKVPKKRKLQEQIDAQVAKEIEEESNKVIANHLQEYEQAAADLSVEDKIELINELVKYQDHHTKILKYQAQKSKPLSKNKQREFYMSILRSHAGWKTRHFRGMTLEEIKEKFIPVWKQLEDFVPMSSKEEAKRVKRKGQKLDQGSSKRMKTPEDVSEEKLKEMMQLVPLEEVCVEALQVKHPIIDWEIHSEEKREY
nr:hypothetical protein [Tanacetum cinerariifolium]